MTKLPDHQFTDLPIPDSTINPDGVILRRDETGVHTNVPHLCWHHSPTGFEFGYGGSGPADLALNILEYLLREVAYTGERTHVHHGSCYALAWALHQHFKFQFIASSPYEGCTISYLDLMAWLGSYMPELRRSADSPSAESAKSVVESVVESAVMEDNNVHLNP